MDNLKKFPQAATNNLKKLPQAATNNLKKLPQAATNNLKKLPQAATNNLKKLPQAATNNLKNAAQKAGNLTAKTAQGVGNLTAKTAQAVGNVAAEAAENLINLPGAAVSEVVRQGQNLSKLPQAAVQEVVRQGANVLRQGRPKVQRQNSRQAWPSRLTAAYSKVDLVIQCRRLPKKNSFSEADAFCGIWEVPVGYATNNDKSTKVSALPAKHEKEVGRTEVVRCNRNPNFEQTFRLQFKFYLEQTFVVRVYDEDLRYSTDLKEHDFIGGSFFSLGELMGSPGCAIARPLRGKAFVILIGQEIVDTREVLEFRFSGQDLGLLERNQAVAKEVLEKMEKLNVAKNVLEKLNPFFRLEKLNPEDQSWSVVWKSEVIKDEKNPTWDVARLPLPLLCNDDPTNPLKISVWVWNRFTPDEFVGFCETSVEKLVHKSKRGIPIFDIMIERRKIFGLFGGKKLKKSGSLKVIKARIVVIPSMLQYFAGGCEMDLMLAVDCTLANGLWRRDEKSLHYRGSSFLNDYQAVIKKIGTIFEAYEGNRDFIMWGYGAKIKGEYCTHFPMGQHLKDADSLLRAYDETFSEDNLSLDMSKTGELKPVVQAAMYRSIRNSQEKQCYSTLVILSTGELADLQDTIEVVCAAAEDAPLSIVVIGIGDGDFEDVKVLAGGDLGGKLCNLNGVPIARNMVKFAELNSVFGNISNCVAEALSEIPEQFVQHFMNSGLMPQPPKPVPDFTREKVDQKSHKALHGHKSSRNGGPPAFETSPQRASH